jgi:hypothetical protein
VNQSAPDFISSVSAPLAVTSGNLTVNLAGYATETFVTSQGYITSAALTPFLTKADNLGSLTNFATARDNLNLGTLNSPTFAALTLQGSGANVGQYTPTSLTLTHATSGSFVIQPSSGITFPDTSVQTTAFPAGSDMPTGGLTGQALVKVSNSNYDADWATITSGATWGSITGTLSSQTDLQTALNLKSPLASPAFTGTPTAPTPSPGTDSTRIATTEWVKDLDYAPLNSPQFNGNPRGPTPSLSDDDTSLATTEFVKGQGYITSSALSPYLLSSTAASTYQTISGMSSYLTSATAASTYRALSNNTFGNIEVNSGNSITINDGGIHPNNVFLDNNGIDIRDGTTFAQVAAFRLDGVILPSAGLTFSDTTTQTSAGISAATAASTYYLQTNPAGYITSAAISGLAPLASPALTGNVTITSNSAGAALFIEQAGTGNILTLHDQASDTTFVAIDQNGKVNTVPAVTTGAGFNIPHGTTPTSGFVNGDIWTTTSGLFARINGSSNQIMDLTTTQTVAGSKTFTNQNLTFGNSATAGTINIGTGNNLTGAVKTVNIGTNGTTGSTNINIGSASGTTLTINGAATFTGANQTLGSSTLATTVNVASGATASTFTKTLNLGTGGLAGSTTNIAIGSTTGTSTTTLQGITNGVTQSAGDSSLKLATTAFVTAAVPAAATHTQALQFSSTSAFTKVIDASSQLIAPSVLKVWPSPSNYNGTATSGAGASAVLYLTGYILTSPSAGVAGNARAFHGNISGDLAGMLWGGTNVSTINFSRRVSMAFRFAQFPSSTASVTRVLLGKIHGTAVGDLTSRGIGVKYVPNGANFDFQLQVHNGTTLTSVTSSTQYAGGVADLEVVSDGAGNATLYLNGASVATTTGAPTGQTGANATVFAEIESTASTANQPSATIGRLYVNSLNF